MWEIMEEGSGHVGTGRALEDLRAICEVPETTTALAQLKCCGQALGEHGACSRDIDSFARMFTMDDIEVIRRELSQVESPKEPSVPPGRVFKFLSKFIVERDSDKVLTLVLLLILLIAHSPRHLTVLCLCPVPGAGAGAGVAVLLGSRRRC